jgi:hypothetical protein
MKYALCLLAVALTFVCAIAQELETRTIVITDTKASLEEVAALLKRQLSPAGKMEINAPGREIKITDTAAVWQKLDPFVKSFSGNRPNVYIEVVADQSQGMSQQQAALSGRPVHVMARGPDGRVVQQTISGDLGGNRFYENRQTSQSLVVQSGETGYLFVGENVPYVQAFSVGPGGYTQAGIGWQSVGTQLAVRPTVVGDTIRLEVFPQISGVVNGSPQTVSYSQYATTINIKNGGTARIGGFAQAGEAFNQGFFYAGRQSASFNQGITVRAMIEGQAPPSHLLQDRKPQMYQAAQPTP